MKKMLVADYDGTFYLNDEDIKGNIEAVNKFRKNGNLFVIATGRSYQDFMNVTKDRAIEYDYLILNAGTCILDNDGKYLDVKYIGHDTVKSIYNELINY